MRAISIAQLRDIFLTLSAASFIPEVNTSGLFFALAATFFFSKENSVRTHRDNAADAGEEAE